MYSASQPTVPSGAMRDSPMPTWPGSLLNGYFFSLGKRNLCAAVSARRDCHGLILGHPGIGEKNAEQEGNKKPARPDHHNQSLLKSQFHQQCVTRGDRTSDMHTIYSRIVAIRK